MRQTTSKFNTGTGNFTVKQTFGKILSLFGYNAGADVFLQLHSVAAPAGITTLLAVVQCPAGQAFSLDIPNVGMDFPALYVCQSSTALTFNQAAANSIGFTTVILAN